jgi:hypothetical protein
LPVQISLARNHKIDIFYFGFQLHRFGHDIEPTLYLRAAKTHQTISESVCRTAPGSLR